MVVRVALIQQPRDRLRRRARRDRTQVSLPAVRRISVDVRPRSGPATQTVKPSARNCSRPSSVILSGPHGGFHTQLILMSLTSPAPTKAVRD